MREQYNDRHGKHTPWKCLFGFHPWQWFMVLRPRKEHVRHCANCDKWQVSVYGYEEMWWETIPSPPSTVVMVDYHKYHDRQTGDAWAGWWT